MVTPFHCFCTSWVFPYEHCASGVQHAAPIRRVLDRMQDPSNTIGTVRESGWVAAAPWTPTATPPAVMLKFENTTTACAPEDDTAISEVLHSAEAHAGPAADDPSGSGGDCYLASDRGRGYSGQMATTESGRACLHWGEHDQPGGGNIFSDPRLQDMCAPTCSCCSSNRCVCARAFSQ